MSRRNTGTAQRFSDMAEAFKPAVSGHWQAGRPNPHRLRTAILAGPGDGIAAAPDVQEIFSKIAQVWRQDFRFPKGLETDG